MSLLDDSLRKGIHHVIVLVGLAVYRSDNPEVHFSVTGLSGIVCRNKSSECFQSSNDFDKSFLRYTSSELKSKGPI